MKDLTYLTLSDIYGDALTEKQRDILTDYYARDFSLSEIADNRGISRQGVRFSLKSAEENLAAYERKFGLYAFLSALLGQIDDAANSVPASGEAAQKLSEMRELIRSKYGTVR